MCCVVTSVDGYLHYLAPPTVAEVIQQADIFKKDHIENDKGTKFPKE